MYYIPLEMRREMAIDYHIIAMFHNAQPHHHVSGIWQTYQGEIYVKELYRG